MSERDEEGEGERDAGAGFSAAAGAREVGGRGGSLCRTQIAMEGDAGVREAFPKSLRIHGYFYHSHNLDLFC